MSALMIQGNDVMVDTYSNKEETNYGFIVYLMKQGEIHTKIVSTFPNFPYEDRKKAKEIGEALVKEVKEMDLKPQTSGLQKIIGEKESEAVSKIVHAANNPSD